MHERPEIRVYIPSGNTEEDVALAHQVAGWIRQHPNDMVQRTPEELVVFFQSGRSLVAQVRDGDHWRNAAHIAISHYYEKEGRTIGELGVVVSDPMLNGRRRAITAAGIEAMMQSPIVNGVDHVFALVLGDNDKSLRMFDTLSPRIADLRLLPAVVFEDQINGFAVGPESYVGFALDNLRREKRQQLMKPTSQRGI